MSQEVDKDKPKRTDKAKAKGGRVIDYAVIGGFMLLMGLFLISMNSLQYAQHDRFLQTAQTTQGTVFKSGTDYRGRKYQVDIAYMTTTNQNHTLSFYPQTQRYEIGDTFEVFYDPTNPERAFVHETLESKLSVRAITSILGVGFMSFGLYLGVFAIIKAVNPNSKMLPDS